MGTRFSYTIMFCFFDRKSTKATKRPKDVICFFMWSVYFSTIVSLDDLFYLGVPYKVLCMSYVIYFVLLLTLPRYKGVIEFLFYVQFWCGFFFGFLITFLVCIFQTGAKRDQQPKWKLYFTLKPICMQLFSTEFSWKKIFLDLQSI